MVALDIHSRSAITEVLDAVIRTSDHDADVLVSRLYAEHIHNLFNYGMNAYGNQALVKDCVVELFLLVGSRFDLLREGGSVDSNLFKMFRRLLMQQIVTSRTSIEDFFSAETQMTQGLTSLQREALFLKFQRRLTYREVANVMDITIEQLRSQISKAVDLLLRREMSNH
jgi:DNA-directed RNA polymerase specialized sigma24 family protein